MTIYNFNLGIGWASSGVEYAQVYRAKIFRKLRQKAKFVFTDLILGENIEHLTRNIGFKDQEIIWLYEYFTDFKISPTTYDLLKLEKSFSEIPSKKEIHSNFVRYFFNQTNKIATAYLKRDTDNLVERVEFVSNGKLIRKDYYTYGRIFSEYYAPKDNKAHIYLRRFFNEDGSMAYEEIIDGKQSLYRFPDHIFYSKEELVEYFVSSLKLTNKDFVIIDRSTRIGPSIMKAKGNAKVGIVIHADHFNKGLTDEDYILWNNFYEFQFENANYIDFFITATEKQKDLLRKHFSKYTSMSPRIFDIPVGSIDKLIRPSNPRKQFSVMTASRIAAEKHIDWAIKSVVGAHKILPQITFDIYGKGGQEQQLNSLIKQLNASDYVHLKGHADLSDIYKHYQLYLSTSTSEGFGLTLLEAIGSGLPIIGFDVPYGNQTFVENGKNGFLISSDQKDEEHYNLDKMTQKIIDLFTGADLKTFREKSYQIARKFMTNKVEIKWNDLLKELND
ncbi:Glycosyltransferase Gtf1 [Oenococcus oeni]|uniref:accessory Sec system glycosyltransferase GtfA n=1 Tax=Oenococcus oeni TaxID=1247 RepID=UPI0010BA2099|nr:accessory Sec system glycosyltransferase GtfA [Oenococcus oeni]SYW05740.1 Glycosyltransferase Gtf1 [Oenococcus oeni]